MNRALVLQPGKRPRRLQPAQAAGRRADGQQQALGSPWCCALSPSGDGLAADVVCICFVLYIMIAS